jgi:hypothetical protein
VRVCETLDALLTSSYLMHARRIHPGAHQTAARRAQRTAEAHWEKNKPTWQVTQRHERELAVLPHVGCLYPGEDVSLHISDPAEMELVHSVMRNSGRTNMYPVIGIVASDPETGRVENVGVLVRLRCVTHAGDTGAFISGEAEGRFKLQRLHRVKPYMMARAREVKDVTPADADADGAAGVVEERVWQLAREARSLANSLYGHLEGPELLDLTHTSLWRPSAGVFEPSVLGNVAAASAADELQAASGECEVVWGGHDSDYALACEARRRQRFSFALARALDLDEEMQQLVLRGTSTTQRLRWLEHHLEEGLGYLRARQSLRTALDSD